MLARRRQVVATDHAGILAERDYRAAWAATALFYTALHYAQAALRQVGNRPPRDHAERKAQLRKYPALDTAYETLKDLSQQCRYGAVKPSQARLAMAELSLAVVKAEAAKIAAPPY